MLFLSILSRLFLFYIPSYHSKSRCLWQYSCISTAAPVAAAAAVVVVDAAIVIAPLPPSPRQKTHTHRVPTVAILVIAIHTSAVMAAIIA